MVNLAEEGEFLMRALNGILPRGVRVVNALDDLSDRLKPGVIGENEQTTHGFAIASSSLKLNTIDSTVLDIVIAGSSSDLSPRIFETIERHYSAQGYNLKEVLEGSYFGHNPTSGEIRSVSISSGLPLNDRLLVTVRRG